MLTVLFLACSGVLAPAVPQRLDPPKRVAYPGDEVAVRAIDRHGAPLRRIAVRVVEPSGVTTRYTTDQHGWVRFVPDEVGLFELQMSVPSGPQVFAVYRVAARPRRWLHAAILSPLGLLLILVNWRRLRRGS